MQFIDWILIAAPIALVLGFAIYTNRYVRSVADFLSAGRCAGRYLLANAKGESESGLANTVARFEIVLVSGFVLSFWDRIFYPLFLLISISGFVVYRFRETRALTLAQFLEIRYSRPFRLYMGMLAFVAGILNFGVFPAVSARFFIYFLDLPHVISIAGLHLSTFVLLMASYLSVAVFLVLVGGQATMMITDCLEGIFSHLVYVLIAIVLLYIVRWSQIVQMLKTSAPGESLVNPFDTTRVADFNIWFMLMAAFTRVYTTMAFQGKQGFNSAARTAHEQRMGGILGEWRGMARSLMLLLLAIGAMTFIRHPAFAQQSALVHQALASIPDTYLRKQMSITIALRYLLPTGIKGLFCSIMIMGLLAGDCGHLHSWGSIFIQDVVLPLRKKALSPNQHIWLLRFAVVLVAAFAVLFSFFFTQTQYLNLWWALTGGVFTGGAGAAIIGGLYWKRGTTSAAWAGGVTGSALCFLGIACGHFWRWVLRYAGPFFASLHAPLPNQFWFNDQVSGFLAAITAASIYVIVSLLTCKRPFNLDQMLHRGQYAIEAEGGKPVSLHRRFTLANFFRFDSNFTFVDKIVAGGIFWWSMALFIVNVVIALAYRHWSADAWATYWLVTAVALPCVIALVTLIWFGIGGLRDMREFYRTLSTMKRDSRDDGRVDHSKGEVKAPGIATEVAEPVRSR